MFTASLSTALPRGDLAEIAPPSHSHEGIDVALLAASDGLAWPVAAAFAETPAVPAAMLMAAATYVIVRGLRLALQHRALVPAICRAERTRAGS
ncbi:MAG: hypothetical protein AAFR79_03160 [Pseudomonadota bacterium]